MKEFMILLLVCILIGGSLYVAGALPQVAESMSDARIAEAQAQVSIELARASQITALSGLLNNLLLFLLAFILAGGLLAGCFVMLRALLMARDERIAMLEIELARMKAITPGQARPGLPYRTHSHARKPEPVIYVMREQELIDR